MRRIVSFCWSFSVLCCFIVVGLFVGGFIRYASVVTTPINEAMPEAEGIVVLTGGENRLKKAAELLVDGAGKQLLVTGVNEVLSDASLQNVLGLSDDIFSCCVNVDRQAADTIGNALAASHWNQNLQADTLLVVTGAFHMPRAIKELSHALPSTRLFAVPVNVPSGKFWWKERSILRDMLREYVKLAVVMTRDVLSGFFDWPWPTMPGRDASKDPKFKGLDFAKGLERKTVSR